MANASQNPTENKSMNPALDSLRALLQEKRLMNKQLEQDIMQLRARKAHLINLKMESAVSVATLTQPTFNDYFCMIDDETRKMIQYIRATSADKESKIKSYMEQYKAFQNEYKNRIEQPELFDKYTFMTHDELESVIQMETTAAKKLNEAIIAEKLAAEEFEKACESKLEMLSEETEQFKFYLNELKAAKKL